MTYPKLVLPEHFTDMPLIASVSGGKDSTALLCALIELGLPFKAVFADTGWEADETYDYVDYLRAKLNVQIDVVGFPGGMAEKIRRRVGFPARMVRWCTIELKIEPLRAYHRQVAEDTVSVLGIRADESEARSRMAEVEDSADWDGWIWRPLLRWSIADVFAIHHAHGLDVNPLYKRGHDRVGCYPCIFARKEEIRLIADHSPERIDKIAALERWSAEERARRNAERPGRYSHAEASFFQTKIPGKTMGIDEVVDWARRDRKGLEILQPVPTGGCVRWGMCEAPAKPDDEDKP